MDRMSSMLDEQKRINEELLGQMKQMQYQMMKMNGAAGPDNGGGMMGGSSNGGPPMSSMGGGGYGYSTGNRGSYGNDDGYGGPNYGGMGSGYGGGYGGGKMGSGGMGGGGMGASRGMPYNMRIPKQPGDWDCPKCGNMNFARRTHCNGEGGTCKMEKRPEFIRRGTEGGPKNRRPGDWDCGRCGNMNYARRDTCNKCPADKSEQRPFSMGGDGGFDGDYGMGGGFGMGGGRGGGYGMGGPPSRGERGSSSGGLETRPGDWKCLECGNVNFSWRDKCNKCEEPKGDAVPILHGSGGRNWGNQGRGSGGPPEARPGDWDCPKCGNLNFSSRTKCNGTLPNGEACLLAKPEFEKYGVAMVKSKMMHKDGDWNCFRCGNVNFQIREECNKCGLPKMDAQSDSFRMLEGDE